MAQLRRLTFDELATQRVRTEVMYGTRRHPISVLLWNVRSAYNVGSIFRTCDAARVEQLILTGYTPTPDRGGVHKTSLGAEKTVPWVARLEPINALAEQRNKGHRIIAVELASRARTYSSLAADDFPATFVFGNELVGISDEILAECDESIVIPMFGVKHSLNVAVSVGIVLYQVLTVLGVTQSAEASLHEAPR